MKTPYVLAVLLLQVFLLSCKKSATVTIAGEVENADGYKVRLINESHPETYDSTIIKNGKFTFHPTVPENGFYYIEFASPVTSKHNFLAVSPFLMYIENNAKYKFIINGPQSAWYDNYQVQTTCFAQVKLNEYHQLELRVRDAAVLKRKRYLNLSDKALTAGNHDLYNNYMDTVRNLDYEATNYPRPSIKEFIKNNRNTLVTPYLMTQLSDLFENHDYYQQVLDRLSPEVKKSKDYERMVERLQSVKNIYVGAKVPDIVGKDVNGHSLNIDYKKNKVTMIDFWASWCQPCREQLPELKELYKKYKKDGLEIVSVSIDERLANWQYASKIEQLPWPSVAELKKQEDSENIQNFIIQAIPTSYLIDSEGKIIGRYTDLDSIKKIMESNKIR